MSASATNGWSVNNLLRVMGVSSATKSAIHAKWEAGLYPPVSNQTIDPARVDDGVSYLVSAGFATLVGSTVSATHVDPDGKPSRLRRMPGHEFTLELLPNGEKPTEGT